MLSLAISSLTPTFCYFTSPFLQYFLPSHFYSSLLDCPSPYHWTITLASFKSCSKTELQVHFAYPTSRCSTEERSLSFTRKPLGFEIISISCKIFAKHFPDEHHVNHVSCFYLRFIHVWKHTSMLTGPERPRFKVKDILQNKNTKLESIKWHNIQGSKYLQVTSDISSQLLHSCHSLASTTQI